MDLITPQTQDPQFNVIMPQPFLLETQDQKEIEKIVDEIISKVELWEKAFSNFFGEWNEASNSFRMIPKEDSKKPRGMFNSKSGETNRATNTLATLWFRMLTSGDPFFECVRSGLNNGRELTPEELYATESVIRKQLQVLQFKKKLLNSLRSVSLFGTAIVEEPFISLPYNGSPTKSFEGTDFLFRSLLQTGFDPYVFDIDCSDYIFTIDYPTKYRLREVSSGNEVWNKTKINESIDEASKYGESGGMSGNFKSEAWNRIFERKQRAGYNDIKDSVFELINYNGKLDSDNKVLQNYWESEGRTDDIKFTDWTIGILNTKDCVRLHPTPFGTWKHHYKSAHYNQFELEPIGYGVGRFGKRYQRELDVTQSRANDALFMAVYSMFKIGKYAGVKASQLNIKPFGLVEMEDINQMEQLKVDMNTIIQALAMMGMVKEDFRAVTGATANLQAVITKATATEASLTQSEAIRSSSVIAEIIAETFLREHIETSHINNTEFLDNDIYVELTGQNPMTVGMNKNNLPKNVGFNIKTVTDKDFRPERIQNMLQILQVITSIRNDLPAETAINTINSLFPEIYRGLGLDPRDLRVPVNSADQLTYALQKSQKTQGGNNNPLVNQLKAEVAGEQSGAVNMEQTPVGAVPTSPLPAQSVMGA